MAKRKKFQKRQLITMFENGNYQKVISKIKQFEIEGMGEDELKEILTTSYTNLANSYFISGDITRALRDINSLLNINPSDANKLIKLKYLCYMEHFDDAIVIGEELINSKDSAIKKEAIFLYILANIYNHNHTIDKNLIKTLTLARQNYIQGFNALVQGDTTVALEFFEKSKPRSKVEKINLNAIISIIKNEPTLLNEDIKPLYRFLIDGDSRGLGNSKNSRSIQKELKTKFAQKNKNSDMKNLIELKSPIDVDIIIKDIEDKDQRVRLIYNNILLLVQRESYTKALEIFIKYRENLIKFIESAKLFVVIIKNIDNQKSNKIYISFLYKYLNIYYKKLAPFDVDYIILTILELDNERGILVAKEYERDNIVFLLKDIQTIKEVEDTHQSRFDNIFKKYSSTTNNLLNSILLGMEVIDESLYYDTPENKHNFMEYISINIELLKNLKTPHNRYKNSIIKLLEVLALLMQSYTYNQYRSRYILLSDTIEHYIEYFKLNRLKLPIDIKALFVSISKERSVKREDIYDMDNDFLAMARRFIGEEASIDSKYNFNEKEYNSSIIQIEVMKAFERGDSNAFVSLADIDKSSIYSFIFEILIKLQKEDNISILNQIVDTSGIRLYDSSIRNDLISQIKIHIRENVELSMEIFEYAINSVPLSNRQSVWYLNWIYSYIDIVIRYKLAQNRFFDTFLRHFIYTQEKKRLKSLETKYKKLKIVYNSKGGLFD